MHQPGCRRRREHNKSHVGNSRALATFQRSTHPFIRSGGRCDVQTSDRQRSLSPGIASGSRPLRLHAMPLRQYFVWVGSILLVMLVAADWCFPAPVAHAPHSEIPPNERINLRIHSDHKLPERVVFDTTRSRFTPAAGVSPEPDVLPSPNLAKTEQHGPLEAFAAKAGD